MHLGEPLRFHKGRQTAQLADTETLGADLLSWGPPFAAGSTTKVRPKFRVPKHGVLVNARPPERGIQPTRIKTLRAREKGINPFHFSSVRQD